MSLEFQLILLARLALAAMLSSVIGLERKRRDKSAGMRTHMLACIGACLFTMVGALVFEGGDPTRVASGVVSGIGFLGAGVIFQSDDRVRDLTTAASIWTVAAIGVAVAVNTWLLAIGATVIVWFTLSILHGDKDTAKNIKTSTETDSNAEDILNG